MNTLQRQARLFRLVRPTAAPGSRMLAEGAEWSDGAVALRWLGRWSSTSTWDGIESLLAVHGDDGDTRLLWFDPPPVRPAVPAPGPSAVPPPGPASGPSSVPFSMPSSQPSSGQPDRSVWLPAPAPDGLCSRCGRPWPCLACGP